MEMAKRMLATVASGMVDGSRTLWGQEAQSVLLYIDERSLQATTLSVALQYFVDAIHLDALDVRHLSMSPTRLLAIGAQKPDAFWQATLDRGVVHAQKIYAMNEKKIKEELARWHQTQNTYAISAQKAVERLQAGLPEAGLEGVKATEARVRMAPLMLTLTSSRLRTHAYAPTLTSSRSHTQAYTQLSPSLSLLGTHQQRQLLCVRFVTCMSASSKSGWMSCAASMREALLPSQLTLLYLTVLISR